MLFEYEPKIGRVIDIKKLPSHERMNLEIAIENRRKKHLEKLIPKSYDEWLDFLTGIVKSHVQIEHLSEGEFRRIIENSRPLLGRVVRPPPNDPDAPACMNWTEDQVAVWIEEMGWPHLKNMFLMNHINGRKLVEMDVNNLRKMGMIYFDEMKVVAAEIRKLLGLHGPNIIRAIMRINPNELFLKKRVFSGCTYDQLVFKAFVLKLGFDYDVIKNNKNVQIPCLIKLFIKKEGDTRVYPEEQDEDDENDGLRLKNAPTVEFVVKNMLARNKMIDEIIEEIVELIFEISNDRDVSDAINNLAKRLSTNIDDMGMLREIAEDLLKHFDRTVEVMSEIDEFEKYIDPTLDPEQVKHFRGFVEKVVNNVMEVAFLLCSGELTLESIFKTAPIFEDFIDDIILEAENTLNKRLLINV